MFRSVRVRHFLIRREVKVMSDNFVITIARGFGSGGKEIASAVAKDMGIHCYENRILTLASEKSGLDRSRFLHADEKLSGSKLINTLRDLPRTMNPKAEDRGFKSNNQLFYYQAEIIKELAATESCVIVGKCADFILKDMPHVYSFYIEAPRAYCLPRIMKKMNISETEAHRLISKTDKYRADYYKYYTGGNYWTNPVNYDLTLNSARVGEQNCIELIKEYVKHREAEYKKL